MRTLQLIFASVVLLGAAICAWAQGGPFRVGERLSYSVSFEKFSDVAHIETSVASRGTIGGRDVIELHGKVKTFDFVSATFSLIDESRTVLVVPETGFPLLINRTIKSGPIPKETTANFLASPTTNYELLSLIYKARENQGVGTFPFSENGENYVATFQPITGKNSTAKIKTDAGEFETTAIGIQSTYLDTRGIKNFRIDLSNDQFRVPVRMTFEVSRGTFTALLSSLTVDTAPPPTDPTPVIQPTPRPAATPRPNPSPTPYIDNLPLLRELKFVLGETLDYRITQSGQSIANVRLSAKERKQFQGLDSLLLMATVTQVTSGNSLSVNDAAVAHVNPDTLAPISTAFRFSGLLGFANQQISVDPTSGSINFASGSIDAPVGTHTLLSLLYAMRSFNLQPGRTTAGAVNDTRVAVFWKDRPHIFTLRPSALSEIEIQGKKIPAQMIGISTNVAELDSAQLKVWLSLDDSRLPLRLSAGTYQMDLTSATVIAP